MGKKSASQVRDELINKERIAARDAAFKGKTSKTVHQAAETGDLAALQSITSGNPSAIYLKHEVGYGTALHYAAQGGHMDCVTLLLDLKAPIDVKISTADTPLHLAAQHGHADVCRLLLERGANTTLKTLDGDTPRDVAAYWTRHDCLKVFDEFAANQKTAST